MEVIIDIVLLLIMVGVAGIIFESVWLLVSRKELKTRLDERQEIINAIIRYKPNAASPDVRDTKTAIIDAITKRSA